MNRLLTLTPALLSAALLCAFSAGATAGILVNPGFETGFSGWTRADQLGSEGTFALQTGTASPVNGTAVPAPPGGTTAAMTDALGPGSHVLYQSFMMAAPVGSAVLSFDLFIGNRSDAFVTPNTLDFATAALNQQARVDILLGSAGAFSVAPADVLMNVYQTAVGTSLVSGYTHMTADVTALLNSHLNTPLLLRFAETDNVFTFQMGVDNADINTSVSAVPEPSSGILILGALCGIAALPAYRRFLRVL